MLFDLPGRNEKGQLGMSDTNRRDNPTKVELLDSFNIVAASCGKNHTLFLTGQTLSFNLSYTELQPVIHRASTCTHSSSQVMH